MMWKILPFFVALFVVGLGSTPQPVGMRNINPSELQFKKALKFAISEYNRKSDEENMYALDEVMKAQIEMEEERVKYTMTVKLGKTFCKKGEQDDFCPIIKKPRLARSMICVFKVVKQHHGMKLLHYKCEKINPWDTPLAQ